MRTLDEQSGIEGADDFRTTQRDGEIQSQRALVTADRIAAGREPHIPGAALAILAQRIRTGLDFRQGLDMVAVAVAVSAGHVALSVHADRAVANKSVIRLPEADVIASADLASETLIRSAGDGVIVAGLRNEAATREFFAVAVEQDGFAALDYRDVELEGILMSAADSAGAVGLDQHRSLAIALEENVAAFNEAFELDAAAKIAIDDSARQHLTSAIGRHKANARQVRALVRIPEKEGIIPFEGTLSPLAEGGGRRRKCRRLREAFERTLDIEAGV